MVGYCVDVIHHVENVYIRCDYIHCRKFFFYGFTWDDAVNEEILHNTYIHCKKV